MAILNAETELTILSQIDAFVCPVDFCYRPSTGIHIGGCAVTTSRICNPNTYVNYIMYICKTAEKTGQAEPVAIKKVRYVKKYYGYVPVYTDSFNRTWFESELCDSAGIQDLILEYEEKQARFLDEYLRTNCNIRR